VLPSEHLLGFPGIDDGGQFIETAREVVEDRLATLSPFRKHGQVLRPRTQGFAEVAILFEPPPALQEFLGCGLVFPEVRGRDTLFYG
jgi:hypothetical protein